MIYKLNQNYTTWFFFDFDSFKTPDMLALILYDLKAYSTHYFSAELSVSFKFSRQILIHFDCFPQWLMVISFLCLRAGYKINTILPNDSLNIIMFTWSSFVHYIANYSINVKSPHSWASVFMNTDVSCMKKSLQPCN